LAVQVIRKAFTEKARKRGKDRATIWFSPLTLGYALDKDNETCVIFCQVTASMSTQRTYETFVQLKLCNNNKAADHVIAAHCPCVGGALGDCTHVAAALYTVQEIVYESGRVPNKSSRIKSCTEKLQKWGVPVGDCRREHLELTMEEIYTIHQIFQDGDEDGVDESDDGEGGARASMTSSDAAKKKRRRSTTIGGVREVVKTGPIGKNVDRARARKIMDELRELNRIEQVKLRETRTRKDERSDADDDAPEKSASDDKETEQSKSDDAETSTETDFCRVF
jgi:hypothetical protein